MENSWKATMTEFICPLLEKKKKKKKTFLKESPLEKIPCRVDIFSEKYCSEKQMQGH